MSKQLPVKTSYCPECGSDNLSLYSLTENGKPCHAICDNCERDDIIEKLRSKNRELEEELKRTRKRNQRYQHHYQLGFSVISTNESNAVTELEIRDALVKRVEGLSRKNELLEAVGIPSETESLLF